MNEIAIIGGGGHAKIIIDILQQNNVKIVGIYDDYLDNFIKINNIPVIGNINDIDNKYQYICSIGDNKIRQNIINDLENKHPNISWVNAIHPSASICSNVKLGLGNTICCNAIIQTNSIIGNHNIINTKASIDHDCIIENFIHIAPGVTICGAVYIGNLTFIGAGSTIINKIKIGSNNIIGSGSNVIRDLGSDIKVYGNPAKVIAALKEK